MLGSDQLTGRQTEIFTLLLQAKSNKEIARALGISDRTVEVHRANIYSKLGVKSVVGLVNHYYGVPAKGDIGLKQRLLEAMSALETIKKQAETVERQLKRAVSLIEEGATHD